MNTKKSVLLTLVAICAPAWAQNCGSGSGTTVCLSTSTTSDGKVQLSWTASGPVTRLEIYRDTDPDANGRSRIAVPTTTTRAYTDATTKAGTSYWYWVKFYNAAGSSSSGAAAVMAGSNCVPSSITPHLNINGTTSWKVQASASLNTGSRVVMGPQPSNWSGNWSWSGCGTSGNSREQTVKLTASCVATAVYTNSCGAKTSQPYAFTVWPAPEANAGKFIMVDQFGYLPNLKKVAVLRSPETGYDASLDYTPSANLQVVNSATGAVVASGSAVAWNSGATDSTSGDRAWTFDFSSVTTPGTYEIVDVDRNQRSARFEIGDNVYRNVLIQAVRMFYYQRVGQTKTAGNAGEGWTDVASHLGAGQDSQARRFLDKNNAATARDLRGGWYDAGDLNKYTSWAAGYSQELLDAYLVNPAVWTDDFNVPESGNGIPDLLDEAKWGLDWLKRMQNSDGSVLSIMGLSHPNSGAPSAATGPSYYGDANTSTTLATAAAFAHGAKVLGGLNKPELKTYTDDLLARAKRAWSWTVANPRVLFQNNDDATGTNGLAVGRQETDDLGRTRLAVSAAIKLYAITGDATYRSYVDANYLKTNMMQNWTLDGFSDVSGRELLHYASLPGATASVVADVRGRFLDLLTRDSYPNWGAVLSQRDPYRAHINNYTWSSNAVKARSGTVFFDDIDYRVSSHTASEAANAAVGYLHYLHGVNPLGKVYATNMTSFGAENSVNNMWHTWFKDGDPKWDSAATSTYGPAPGYLVGGPLANWKLNSVCPGHSSCPAVPPSPPYGQPAQKSYLDSNAGWPFDSWSISEPSNGYQVAYIRLLARFVK